MYLSVPPSPRIIHLGMSPHATPRSTGLALDVFVLLSVGGDGIPIADKPFAHVFVFVQDRAEDTAVFVGALDLDLHMLAANHPNQLALHPQALFVPVAIFVFGHLIQFGRVQTTEADRTAGDPDGVAVNHVGFAGNDSAPP